MDAWKDPLAGSLPSHPVPPFSSLLTKNSKENPQYFPKNRMGFLLNTQYQSNPIEFAKYNQPVDQKLGFQNAKSTI